MHWMLFIVELVKPLAWPGTFLVVLFVFRKIISKKLEELLEFHREGNKLGALFHSPQQADAEQPTAGQTILLPKEVRATLREAQYLDIKEVDRHYVEAHAIFMQRGIVTKQQLDTIVSNSMHILSIKYPCANLCCRTEASNGSPSWSHSSRRVRFRSIASRTQWEHPGCNSTEYSGITRIQKSSEDWLNRYTPLPSNLHYPFPLSKLFTVTGDNLFLLNRSFHFNPWAL